MKKFSPVELSRFNDRIKNVLENESCRKIFKSYLRKTKRKDLYSIYKLWRKAYKYNLEHKPIDGIIEALMEETDDIDEDNLNDIINACCHELDEKVRHDFFNYLNQHHS